MRTSSSFWFGLFGLCVLGAGLLLPRCQAQIVPARPRGPGGFGPTPGVPAPEVQPQQQDNGNNFNVNIKVPNQRHDIFIDGRWKKESEIVLDAKAEGFGATTDDAVESAVKDACRVVENFLQKTYGETQYTPTPEELKRKGMVTVATAHIDRRDDLTDHPQQATLQVKVTGDQIDEMREKARAVRVHERMKWGAMTLVGMVGLLLVGGGYLRLEEATKGYYTTLLRMAALAFVGAIGATLFMLWP
jgi:hypothetical protein